MDAQLPSQGKTLRFRYQVFKNLAHLQAFPPLDPVQAPRPYPRVQIPTRIRIFLETKAFRAQIPSHIQGSPPQTIRKQRHCQNLACSWGTLIFFMPISSRISYRLPNLLLFGWNLKNYWFGRRKSRVWFWVLLLAVVGCFVIMLLRSYFRTRYLWNFYWVIWNYAAPSGLLHQLFKVI